MGPTLDETALARLEARLADLERANARMAEELAALRRGGTTGPREEGLPQPGGARVSRDVATPALQRRASRHGMLRNALTAAAATAAAGTLLQSRTETALATNGNFNSSTPGVPGVLVTTTNGAEGVKITSDGAGVDVYSATAEGVKAISNSPASAAVYAKSTYGPGVWAESQNAEGVKAISDALGGVGLSVQGRVVLGANPAGTSAVGQVTMPTGAWHFTVSSSAATAQSMILLSPTSDPKTRLWATSATDSFTIYANFTLPAPVTINYLIIN